jgi:hypothetical protein
MESMPVICPVSQGLTFVHFSAYAFLVGGGSNGNGARSGMVTIIGVTDPHPYTFQTPVSGV